MKIHDVLLVIGTSALVIISVTLAFYTTDNKQHEAIK